MTLDGREAGNAYHGGQEHRQHAVGLERGPSEIDVCLSIPFLLEIRAQERTDHPYASDLLPRYLVNAIGLDAMKGRGLRSW